MTFSYSNLLTTALDRIRFALSDTDATAVLVENETITAKLTAYGLLFPTDAARTEAEATADLAEALAQRFALSPSSYADDDIRVAWADRVKNLVALATRIREGVARSVASTAASSVSVMREAVEEGEFCRPTWWTA